MRTRTLLLAGVLMLLPTVAEADDPFALPSRGQWSSKLIGVTVIPTCPTPEVLTKILEKGKALHADYTDFPEVAGASRCPATLFGETLGYSQLETRPDVRMQSEGTWRLSGGVTVGLHYRVQR